MELLLNLIWLALAAGALLTFARRRQESALPAQGSRWTSLLALSCVLLLLFPVVSASDDLHPTQAVVEDASKKIQLAVAPLHLLRTVSSGFMLLALVFSSLIFALLIFHLSRPTALAARMLNGASVVSAGRAPPFRGN